MELFITEQEYNRIKDNIEVDFEKHTCKDGVVIRISPNDYHYVFGLLSNKKRKINRSRNRKPKKTCCSWFKQIIKLIH